MMKTNKVFENTATQIKSTTEVLKSKGFVIFDIPPERIIMEKRQQLTWQNHQGGRLVSSKAFLTIDQYLEILSSNAYQLLLSDYSIIRYSFVFDGAKLEQQNILWWPCPVKMDIDTENEFGVVEGIKQKINASSNQSEFIMRSPVRIDFDSTNNTNLHPRAHIHLEHSDCRINTEQPICFNQFIKFIITNFYPQENIDFKRWLFLNYQYDSPYKKMKYDNSTSIIF